jgi:hypothetical protein
VGHGGADGEEGNVRGVEEVGVLERPFLVRGEIAVDRGFGFTGTSDAITGVGADGHKIEEGFAGVEVAAAGCFTKEISGRVMILCAVSTNGVSAVNFFTLTFRNHIASTPLSGHRNAMFQLDSQIPLVRTSSKGC